MEKNFICGMLNFCNLFVKSVYVLQTSVTVAWFPEASNRDLRLPHTRKGPDSVKFTV